METMAISPERAERRRRQEELADRLKASGALDEIFAKIDAGEPLTGEQGLLGGMLRAALERGLDAELTEHVGYGRGDPEASRFENSRNGTSAKTVATEIGDIELAVPRDRNGTFTPMLVPKGQRRLGAWVRTFRLTRRGESGGWCGALGESVHDGDCWPGGPVRGRVG